MGKKVDARSVKDGDVLATKRGKFVCMMNARMNRKGSIVIEGAYEKDMSSMMKNPKDTSKMRFYTLTHRSNEPLEIVSKVSMSVTKKLREMSIALSSAIEAQRSKKMSALDLKWNPDAQVKSSSGRMWKGAYDVVTQKGEHVKAGDLVMVKFSNGQFEMVMGNDKGQTYDGKTGNFLCRAPWKANKPAKVKLALNKYGQVGYKQVVTKARSMPPHTLLYRIKTKEEYDKTRGFGY